MSGIFSIEKPSVLALLPRPIDYSNGRYVVSDVHGGILGSRKRKRSELAIGVDGEGLSIYDTRSSKLVASYPVSPQSSFTCKPSSVRLRTTGIGGVDRRTYVSVKEEQAKIILFRDHAKPDGTTDSNNVYKIIEADKNGPVVYLGTIPDLGSPNEDCLLIVQKAGQVLCLDGLDLTTRWTSPAGVLGRNTTTPEIINHRVDFAYLTDAHHASKSLLKNRGDLLSHSKDSEDGHRRPILVVITTPDDAAFLTDRTLHILSLPITAKHGTAGIDQAVHPLLSVSLPWTHQDVPVLNSINYSLHTTIGALYELCDHFLAVIDLKDSRPKVRSRMYLENSNSFVLLSSSSVLAASAESITIYYPAFQSVLASTIVKSDPQFDSRKRKINSKFSQTGPRSCRLVAYSPKQSTAYAIADDELLAFQIDSGRGTTSQSRTIGLLSHSLGFGIAKAPKLRGPLGRIPLASFGSYTAGSDTSHDRDMEGLIAEMDLYVLAQDVEAFERVMVRQLRLTRNENELHKWQTRQIQKKKIVNGVSSVNGIHDSMEEAKAVEDKPIPSWRWPKHKSAYPEVDPRWVDYALSRIFAWSKTTRPHRIYKTTAQSWDDLIIVFYPHNLVNWLIETGNLTPATIQSALRQDSQVFIQNKIQPGQLVTALSEVDPGFEMLSTLLAYTFLDAKELLQAVRLLMQSLELFGEAPLIEPPLLDAGEVAEMNDSELQATIEIEQEKADKAIVLAEHRLEDYSSVRGKALSLALAKLSACPIRAVVSALRSMFSSSEIVSLIYLLVSDLGRGAWTTRYLDMHNGEGGEDDAEHDNSIILISDLLNCCVDAIGAGGWLAGDAMLLNGDVYLSEELITRLKLEVSAALEGIEEASYLKGLMTEMVRYGEAMQAAPLPASRKRRKGEDAKPIPYTNPGDEATMLPLGMKAGNRVPLQRIGAAGEIRWRTARDIGQLKSMKVGKYSRERIDI